MLQALRKTFSAPAAAFAVGAAAVMSAAPAYAEDGKQVYAANTTVATSSTSATIEEIEARNAVIDKSVDFARLHPGQIGFSVLGGSDTRSVEPEVLTKNLESGITNRLGVQAVGYTGDNGNKATEISYAYAFYNPETEAMDVRVRGPYNADQAIPAAKEVADAVKAQTMMYQSSYDPR